MMSVIVRTAARGLRPVLLLYAVFLLMAGHNEPGGGFVAGLVASAAVALHAIAYDVLSARRMVPVEPRTLIGVGLLLALASGVWPLLRGQQFLTGQWGRISGASVNGVALGTPLLFDAGVFALVIGATVLMILSLAEG